MKVLHIHDLLFGESFIFYVQYLQIACVLHFLCFFSHSYPKSANST